MRAFIGLGSNVGCRVCHIRSALRGLSGLPGCRVLAVSRFYQNPALTLPEQGKSADYVNAVALLETRLSPFSLMHFLLALEERHGRVRTERWGPRTLDLDLLLYEQVRLRRPLLTLPHPRMHLRAFVLYPLLELAPRTVIPGRGRVTSLLKHSKKELRVVGVRPDRAVENHPPHRQGF
ncbi:2-amino-4-hydroxy-6-hydroxymethyldihydropteridinediphosphokinase [Gammaproteobacteria bacterium]